MPQFSQGDFFKAIPSLGFRLQPLDSVFHFEKGQLEDNTLPRIPIYGAED